MGTGRGVLRRIFQLRDRLKLAASARSNSMCSAPTSGRKLSLRQRNGHGSVERLCVPLITTIASACLVERDTLADIKPSFENDTNIVSMPPGESAFSNCEKVVERDVEVYRKEA